MTKKKQPTTQNPHEKAANAYHNQIEPLIKRLMGRCKHYGMTALISVSIPVTEDVGANMTYLQPNKSGLVPSSYIDAKNAIEAPNAPAAAAEDSAAVPA